MKKQKIKILNLLNKACMILFVQVLIFGQFAWAEEAVFHSDNYIDTLSPQIQINNSSLHQVILGISAGNIGKEGLESGELKPVADPEYIKDIAGLLRDLGFNYADKFLDGFKVKTKNQYGDAQILVVTKDKENAFILRQTLEFSYGKGVTQRRINLIEFNPFTPNTGFEHENGFCRYQIHQTDNSASLGANHEIIVRTKLSQNNGLASAMLSLAISNAHDLGAEKINVYNVTDKAVSLYQKLGFIPVGGKIMNLDLTKVPVADTAGQGSWLLNDVSKHRGFKFIDLKQKKIEQPEIDTKKIKDSILYNPLIQKFFSFSEEQVHRKTPWSYVLYDILHSDNAFLDEVIKEMELKGEDWIVQQAEIIRETHSSRSSYADTSTDTGGSWTAFINKTDDFESYNLAHLLAHSIGYVKNYIEIDEEARAEEFFKTGYIILRAIDIESRNQDNSSSGKKKSNFLPKVKLNHLSEDQAFRMADMLYDTYAKAEIHLLEDAEDINPEYAYSLNVVDDLSIVFIAQDQQTIYSLLEVSSPETYYIAVTDGEAVIGYGAIDYNAHLEEDAIFVAFRIFKQYRHKYQKVSGKIFKSLLSGAREIFGQQIRKFLMLDHQINCKEGINSGAVVFYLKLGFKLNSNSLQALWEMKYLDRVMAGQKLNKQELKGLAQSGIILDLNDLDNPEYSIISDGPVGFKSIGSNLTFINSSL